MDFPQHENEQQNKDGHPPAFNMPVVVSSTIGILFLIHLATSLTLGPEALDRLFIQFGYITQRQMLPPNAYGDAFARYYSLFSHAFLHVGWQHLIFNIAWLAVFGSPVARRYGNIGFVAVFVFGSAVGAIVFNAFSGAQFVVLIGASGAVSAFIGGATRFMFQPIETEVNPDTGEVKVLGRKLAGLIEIINNRRAFSFAAFWLGLNIVFGLAPNIMGVSGAVAWQAHLGGFIAGYFMVAWLERRAF